MTPPAADQPQPQTWEQLGAAVWMLRDQGVGWKAIEHRFHKSRPTLKLAMSEYLGLDRCVCPRCGNEFDPKKHRRP